MRHQANALRFRSALVVFATSVLGACVGESGPPIEGATEAVSPGINGKIAFASDRYNNISNIFVMNPDGSSPTRLTDDPDSAAQPVFSPDGSKIAFVSDRGTVSEIWVMNADGSSQTQLSTGGGFAPTWSPDGSKIAFESYRTGDFEIWVMNADGSSQTNLTNSATTADSSPAWSPDGTKIAFASDRSGDKDIWVMGADGSSPANLTNNNNGGDDQPSWSPDGSKIAFTSTRTGNQEIFVMASDGSSQTNLTNSSGDEGEPTWSPDGSKIAFDVHGANTQIYLMNASNGAGQVNITNDTTNDEMPSWQTIPSADLALGLAATPNVVRSNQLLTYTLTVTNAGPSAAGGVVVTDPLPAGARFVSATPSQGTCLTPPSGSTGTITCNLGFLLNNTVRTAQIAVKVVVRRTTITNTATVSSNASDPNTTNNSASITTQVR